MTKYQTVKDQDFWNYSLNKAANKYVLFIRDEGNTKPQKNTHIVE